LLGDTDAVLGPVSPPVRLVPERIRR
jgi:hypothetical protein